MGFGNGELRFDQLQSSVEAIDGGSAFLQGLPILIDDLTKFRFVFGVLSAKCVDIFGVQAFHRLAMGFIDRGDGRKMIFLQCQNVMAVGRDGVSDEQPEKQPGQTHLQKGIAEREGI